MTIEEKLVELAKRIAPDTDTDEVLKGMLSASEALILNRMFPFGYTETQTVPRIYEQIQIQLAVELYNKRGAEGQTAHSENGISRSWPEKTRLLSLIVPTCASVVKR